MGLPLAPSERATEHAAHRLGPENSQPLESLGLASRVVLLVDGHLRLVADVRGFERSSVFLKRLRRGNASRRVR
jgi:hypothetical protein